MLVFYTMEFLQNLFQTFFLQSVDWRFYLDLDVDFIDVIHQIYSISIQFIIIV